MGEGSREIGKGNPKIRDHKDEVILDLLYLEMRVIFSLASELLEIMTLHVHLLFFLIFIYIVGCTGS